MKFSMHSFRERLRLFLFVRALFLVVIFANGCNTTPPEDSVEYNRNLKNQLDETKPQLPSDCRRMAQMWDYYLDRFPDSNLAAQARQIKARWEAKVQDEIRRGFQIIIEEAEVQPIKGSWHTQYAGRPWDPEIWGSASKPDPYALVFVADQLVLRTDVVRDSFHAAWNSKSQILRVDDEKRTTIRVLDRDVAKNLLSLTPGFHLGSAVQLMQAANAIADTSNDDLIGEWNGTIKDLIVNQKTDSLLLVQDCQIRAKVTRP